jgi:hypothetical protein
MVEGAVQAVGFRMDSQRMMVIAIALATTVANDAPDVPV